MALTREEKAASARHAIAIRWKDKTKVTPATIDLVKHACASGATIGNIVDVLGISERKFYRFIDQSEEFAAAVKQGRSIEHDRLVNKLVDMALGGNIAALIYALKARHGMLDNQVNQVVENRVAITFQLPDSMKPEDYLRTLTATAEVIGPTEVARVLAKPGVKGKVLKGLAHGTE